MLLVLMPEKNGFIYQNKKRKIRYDILVVLVRNKQSYWRHCCLFYLHIGNLKLTADETGSSLQVMD